MWRINLSVEAANFINLNPKAGLATSNLMQRAELFDVRQANLPAAALL
ncbi:hypothetical protein [Campylobacter sp.]